MWKYDDPAAYLARRIRYLRGCEGRIGLDEIVAVAEERGIAVEFDPRLREPGRYVDDPDPGILLRPNATVLVGGHEVGHGVLNDNLAHDIEYPELSGENLERVCDRFAEILIGEEPTTWEPTPWMRGFGERKPDTAPSVEVSPSAPESRLEPETELAPAAEPDLWPGCPEPRLRFTFAIYGADRTFWGVPELVSRRSVLVGRRGTPGS